MSKFWGIIIGICLLALPAKATVLLNDAEFMAALQKEFVEQGHDEKLEMEFFGGQTVFVIEDAEQGTFSANAEIFADGKHYSSTNLTGKFYVLGEAFVPVEEIAKGEEITEDKLELVPMRLNRIKDADITAKEKLVGMEAKRTLKPGRLINERDIGSKIIMKKGALVTSIYRSKGLQITAQAIAQEDGAKGELIKVENTKSGKKFRARVVDAETVEVQ